MLFHALKQAVKKICPDFILRRYRYFKQSRYFKQLNANSRRFIAQHLSDGGGIELIELEL